MKPVMKATARVTRPEADDPWQLGYRYCPVVGPDGQQRFEEVPLTPEDFLYPHEDDRFMYTRGHALDCTYLEVVLDDWCKTRPGRLTLREHRVDFGVAGIKPMGPDLIVLGRVREWDNRKGTLRVATAHARPLLVIEVTSPNAGTRDTDLVVKRDLYHRCKVPFYAIVDRQAGEERNEVRILGYRRTAAQYVPVPADARGRVWLTPVRLWLGVENDRAVCYDAKGKRIPPPNERASEAEAKAATEAQTRIRAEREKSLLQKRVKELEAQLRKRRK